MKTHLYSCREDDRPNFPSDVICLCGAEVKEAKPVLELEIMSGALSAQKTMVVCHTCLLLALSSTSARTWIFGLLPAEQADRANNANEISD